LEKIINAALEGEMDTHMDCEERSLGNRRNGYTSKQVQNGMGGVKDILIACTDNLSGFSDAIRRILLTLYTSESFQYGESYAFLHFPTLSYAPVCT
jgi:transposase-like protein